MTTNTISSGQTVSGSVISSGDTLRVLSGGAADSTAVSGGGMLEVDSGGIVSGTIVAGQNLAVPGLLNVTGGVASDTQVISGGSVAVSAGGVTIGLTLSGIAFTSTSSSGSMETVGSGGLASATSVGALTILEVDDGGVASAAVVGSGGSLIVTSGGQVSGSTIGSGGSVTVSSGGTGNNAILAGGFAVISQGGAADNTAILSGGKELLLNSASGSGITVSSGGTAEIAGAVADVSVLDGGSAVFLNSGLQEIDGAIRYVNFAGTGSGITVGSGGRAILGGGAVSGIEVESGGVVILGDGAVTGVRVESGGTIALAGGPVTGLTLESGAREIITVVAAGETLSGGTVYAGYPQTVLFGGETIDAKVLKSAFQGVGGVTVGTILKLSAQQFVGSGGRTTGTQIGDKARQSVDYGGIAVDTIVSSNGQQYVSGIVSATTVQAGGSQTVGFLSNGRYATALDTTVDGTQILNGGVSLNANIDAGGLQEVSRGGIASNTTIMAGGHQTMKGGFAVGTTILGGGTEDFVSAYEGYGFISDTTVDSGGVEQLQYVEAVDTVVAGGVQYVNAYSIVSNTTVLSGGRQIVSPQTTVRGVIVGAGGSSVLKAGATASDVTVLSGGELVVVDGVVTNLQISSGGHVLFETVSSGTIASGRIVTSGMLQKILSGGSAVDTTVLSGGKFIYAGGTVSELTVSSGGEVDVAHGRIASDVIVRNGVLLKVSGGASVRGLVISAGGYAEALTSGAHIIDADILSNGVLETHGHISGVAVSRGGTLLLSNAGKRAALDTTVLSGGVAKLVGGRLSSGSVIIDRGGKLFVSSAYLDGQRHSLILSSGAELVLLDHAETFDIVAGGNVLLSSGSILDTTTVVAGGHLIFAGGRAENLFLSAGGHQTLGAKVRISGGVQIFADSVLTVSSGAAVSAYVSSGGKIVFAGGRVTRLRTTYGAMEVIAAGAVAKGLDIAAGVTLTVHAGGAAKDMNLDYGTEIVKAGAKTTGVTHFTKSATLSIADNTGIALKTSGFKATDTIDVASFKFGTSEKLTFVENAAKTSGVLNLADGRQTAKITLFGQYTAAGFHLSRDGAGTAITYSASHSGATELASPHA